MHYLVRATGMLGNWPVPAEKHTNVDQITPFPGSKSTSIVSISSEEDGLVNARPE